MNCWKNVNLARDLGTQRLFIISLITMLLAFVTMYVSLSLLYPKVNYSDEGLLLFILSLLLMNNFHKIFHAVPSWLFFKKPQIMWERTYHLIPEIKVKFCQKSSKQLLILSMLAPTIGITFPLVIGSYMYPEYMHYFVILASYNIGLSLTDFLYLFHFLKAPRQCYIENFNEGYDILIQREN